MPIPFGPCTSCFPSFPAYFRGLGREIDGCKQSTSSTPCITVKIAIPDYPERVLKGSKAYFQLIGNVQGLRGHAVKVQPS